jgi:PAS domain S-box-containing protein
MNPTDQKFADADVADLLVRSSLARYAHAGAPLVVAAEDPPQIVFANQAAQAIFHAANLQQMNATAMNGTSPGARRLRQLAGAQTVGGAPRLELLRFFVDRLPLQLSLLCARVTDTHGKNYLIAAASGGAPTVNEPASVFVVAPSEAITPDEPDEKQRPPHRFLWSVDADACFEEPVTALVEAVGDATPRAAESLEALKARTGLDESGKWAEALATRQTFASLRVAWPRHPLQDLPTEAIVVVLSGAPIFDRERRFLGYRGFGIFNGETTLLARARVLVEPNPEPLAPPALNQPVSAEAARPTVDEEPQRPPPPPATDTGESQQASPERSAEIVPLRSPGPSYPGSPNVVPIRPGAPRQPLGIEEGPRRAEDNESVELTTHERDAFREIARALGAKPTDRETRIEPPSASSETRPPSTQDQSRDLLDLGDTDPAHRGRAATSDGQMRADDNADAQSVARNAVRLIDLLPIGALIARGDETLYLNRTLLDLLGYQDSAQFRRQSGLARIFKGGRPEQIGEGRVLSLISAAGEEIAVDGQVQTIEWDDAPATLISLRRSAEAEYAPRLRALDFVARTRETEAQELSTVLDTATDGIVMLDSQARILSLNRPAEALFGFDQKEVAGENFLTLLSPESREPVKAYFDGLQTSGLASLLNDGREALGRERHGRAIPLFITMGRINASPEAKFCAVLRDMTQWKTIERDLEAARGQAERASALKSEFLAKISHEIRTPLHAILGFAEVIMDERFGPLGNDRYKEYLKDIHASGAHVMSLVNDLLDLSKIEAGKHDFNFVALDANSIIQECVSLMQPQAAQERIIMRLSLFDKLPPIIADERSLRQIMLNLMSNAVKFNEPGGQVIVSTALNESGQAVIRVRDTGIGMSEDDLGAAMEPFRQISSPRQKGGTGLGLPLTKALVEANRAGISIKSRREQGTLVEIAFPTAHAAAAQ